MKKLVLMLMAALLMVAGACKEKKKDPEPAGPEPVKYGTVNFDVTTYNEWGYPEQDPSGVKVFLVEDNLSAMTDAEGKASFSNLPYGYHTPVLTKEGYDGPLVTVYLNSAEHQSNLPFPKHSQFTASNLKTSSMNRDNVYVSFNLSPAIPPDSVVKVLVLGHATPDLSYRKFTSADLITVDKNVNTDINVAMLPNFRSFITPLDSGSAVYVTVAPVSYGLYEGNIQPAPVVLGENLFNPGNSSLTKKWKN